MKFVAESLANVDILIKAFLRPDCVRRLVSSILAHYPDAHLTIADDGDPDEDVRSYYAELSAAGHRVLLLPFNVGISAGRNRLVEASTRPYLLVLDDDFVFTDDTRIETLVEVLEADPSLGVAGGSLLDEGMHLRSYEYLMSIQDRLVHYYPIRRNPRTIDGRECYDTQIVLNFCLFRREVFSAIAWDESLKTSEHTDFFLRLSNTPWKVVHVPSVVVDHYPETSAVYRPYRKSREGDDLFAQKWRTGGDVYHQPDADPRSDRRQVRAAYARAALQLLRARHVGQASVLMVGAATSEARRLGRHTGGPRGRDRLV
jgi:GT2 family glycosyltransferase